MADLPRVFASAPRLSDWIRCEADGTVVVRTGKVEIGQGIVTALAQVVADEIDVDPARIRMQPATTASSPDEGYTAGSMSVEQSAAALRMVGAQVRELRDAAGVRLDELDLDVEVTGAATLKPPESWRVIGTSQPRRDLPAKFAGQPSFVHDLLPAGVLHGRMVRSAVPGVRLVGVDPDAVSRSRATVVHAGGFLGLLAEREEVAVQEAERLRAACRWSDGHELPDPRDLAGWLRTGDHSTRVLVDAGATPAANARRVRRSYSRPFLAHGALLPSCALARWHANHVEVWSHTQGIFPLRAAIASVCGLDLENVVVHHAEGAGCYGHNGADDAALDAVLLARAVPGRPVRVQWSRADELSRAPFGPAMVVDLDATLDSTGTITRWQSDTWSNSHVTRPGYVGAAGLLATREIRPDVPAIDTDDPGGTGRNAVPLYAIAARTVRTHVKLDMPIRTSSLRSLGGFANILGIESFIDELAYTAGADPLEFRLRHLRDERARAVLETAALAGGWGRANTADHGRGLAVARYKNESGWCAVVADVRAHHEIEVRTLTIAADVGLVVNPDGVINQIEGGAVQATSWTLCETVPITGAEVVGPAWEAYPVLRFSQTPAVRVHLIDRPREPALGAGEIVQGPVAAAIANAVFAATGLRARDLPLTPSRMRDLAARS